MASIMAMTLKKGKKIQDNSGTDKHLSKTVELGGKYRLFFKTADDGEGGADLFAALVPGRNCNFDIVKTSFFPFTSSMFECDEQGNITKDLTGLDAWARISSILMKAQCKREQSLIEKEATEQATTLGKPVDQVSLARSLEAIEQKYFGGEAADGSKVYAKEKPAVGSIAKKLTTRIGVVKVGPTGAPEWKNAKYAVWELSKARRDEIISLLENVNYINPSKGYLEVGYDYIGADKQTAGKAKLQGITETISLETAYPEEWASFGKAFVENITPNTDNLEDIANFIISKNANLKYGTTPDDITSCIKTYCSKNANVYSYIDFTDKSVALAAKAFLESHLVDTYPKIKDKFEELYLNSDNEDVSSATSPMEAMAQANAIAANVPETTPTEEEIEQKDMEQVQKILESGAAQTIKSMASSMPDVDLDDDCGDL